MMIVEHGVEENNPGLRVGVPCCMVHLNWLFFVLRSDVGNYDLLLNAATGSDHSEY